MTAKMDTLSSPASRSALSKKAVLSPASKGSPSKKALKSLFRRSKSSKSKKKSESESTRSIETAITISTPTPSVTERIQEETPKFLVKDMASSPSKPKQLFLEEKAKDTIVGLDLVVLLMHPISHRFELLQLEFEDSSKARVSDLLAQIPVSVTEACLKNQFYDSILDINSGNSEAPLVMKSTPLIECFSSIGKKKQKRDGGISRKAVLVARPQGISNDDALRMAKPIFTNKDIANMLQLSGFDISSWESKKFSPKSSVSLSKTKDETSQNDDRNSTISFLLLGFVFAMIIGNLVQSVMVKPVSSDFVLKPGSYKSKCGLSGYIPMKKTARNIFKSIPFSDVVAPGFLVCEDEFFAVNHDGTAVLYDSEHEPIIIFSGDICGSSKSSSLDCVNGLVMKSNEKTLELNGKAIKQALVRKSHRDKQVSPWPFEEQPAKLKYKIGSQKDFGSSK